MTAADVRRLVVGRDDDQDLRIPLRQARRNLGELAVQVGEPQLLDQLLVLVGQAGDDHGDVYQNQGGEAGNDQQDDGRLVSDAEQVPQPVDRMPVEGQVEKDQGRGEPEDGIFLLHLAPLYQPENGGEDGHAEDDGEELDSVEYE